MLNARIDIREKMLEVENISYDMLSDEFRKDMRVCPDITFYLIYDLLKYKSKIKILKSLCQNAVTQ